MARKYDASRRQEQAARTRQAILEAAFSLHGQGVLDLDRLADEANVSVATVRKHFPTREQLFEGCTAHGMAAVVMPDWGAVAAIEDPADRTREAVAQVFALHEALLGHTWVAFKLEDESAAMAAILTEIDAIVSNAASIVSEAWPAAPGEDVFAFAHGMLSPLTYRGLRSAGGLSAADVLRQVSDTLVHAAESARSGRTPEAAHR